MFLKKASSLLFLLFAFVLYVDAQEPSIEYGQASELKGVTKIFVDSGFDAQGREQIVKEIQKRLPNLSIVSRPEDADVHLRYLAENDWDEITGTVVKILSKDRVRVLYSFRETPQVFARRTIVGFGIKYAKPNILAAQFVKVYKKANDIS